jgi:Flp pilus assembly protein TadD
MALDPDSPEAQAWLAEALALRAVDGIPKAPAAEIARAKGLAAQALAASPHSAFAHFAQGRVLCAQGRFEEAIPEFETASAIHPGWPHPYGFLGACKLWTGSISAAIPLIERAMVISPGDPYRASWYFGIGRVHLLQSRINEAMLWLEKARSLNPHDPQVHAWLVAACAVSGEIERARAELTEARGLSYDGRYSSIARLNDAGYFGVPKIRKRIEDTYLAGLRRAGMPED